MFCNKNNTRLSWDDFDGLKELVKSLVKERRYIHTLGVEEEALKFAKIFECDESMIKKLRSAAIFHDMTKEFSREKYLEVFETYNINLSEGEKNAEWSYHAKTAAYIAKFEFGADDMIFGGIYNHTDKSDLMKSPTLFNKIISLADAIEPNRDGEFVIRMREHFYSEIEKAGTPEQKYKIIDETVFDFAP